MMPDARCATDMDMYSAMYAKAPVSSSGTSNSLLSGTLITPAASIIIIIVMVIYRAPLTRAQRNCTEITIDAVKQFFLM